MTKKLHDVSKASGSVKEPPITVTFLVLTVLFCVCLIVSNIMEIKTVMIGPLTLTAGIAVFPVSYIINDCITEVYGYSRARLVIWTGFAANLLVALLLQIGIMLPGTPDWQGQEAMELIFGAVPRILFASFTAFVCGSLANAKVMSVMHRASGGARGFSLRAVVSTLVGESIDSAIFFPIAFGGNLPWSVIVTLMITQAVTKTLYEILVLPLTILIVKRMRRFNPLPHELY